MKGEKFKRFVIKCTMTQIYKSDLVDLFRADDEQICELTIIVQEGKVSIAGSSEIEVIDFFAEDGVEKLIKIFNDGLDNRLMRATDANETSSRSHLLFTMHFESEDYKTPGVKQSKITFIDLAGSERLALIGFDEFLYEEALFINESLRCLERVIKLLALGRDQDSVDFEGNLLTHLLRDSLGGSSKSLLMVMISPSIFDLEATMDTLKFAQRTGKAKGLIGLVPDQEKMSDNFLAFKMIKSITGSPEFVCE